MLEQIQNKIASKKVEALLKKHGLQVKHFLPGRIRIAMPNWQANEAKVLSLIEEMKNDPDITSVEFTKETGTVLIYFNKDAITHPTTLNRWKTTIKKYM